MAASRAEAYRIGARLLVALMLTLALEGRAATPDTPDLSWGRFDLRLDGYIRAGLGLSRDGATQAVFQAPGARAKYRLGNEPETYFELGFDGRYALGAATGDDAPTVQGVFLSAGYAPFGESASLGINDIVQAWLAFGLSGLKKTRVWAGRRYYDRKDIHLNDYFWLNPGQGAHAGLGVEGLAVLGSELKVAVFRLEDSNAPEDSLLDSTSVDLRLAGVDTLPGGALTLWAQYVWRHANDSAGFPEREGFGVGFWHDQKRVLGLSADHTLALLYREGPALTQSPTNARPIREDQGYDLEGARTWELNSSLLFEANSRWAVQWAVVLRWEDRGLGGEDRLRWLSTGVRPMYFLREHVHLALELGYDHVKDAGAARVGNLTKLTGVLQFGRAREYFSRPVLRLFGTGAWWSRSFSGLVGSGPGNAPYGDNTRGWTVGTQIEAWW
ncbi:carbohydrate porin [Pyxidicoccus sp. 3LFB2]